MEGGREGGEGGERERKGGRKEGSTRERERETQMRAGEVHPILLVFSHSGETNTATLSSNFTWSSHSGAPWCAGGGGFGSPSA